MTKPSEIRKSSESERELAHKELLESAFARPGIREVMKIYGGWQKCDRKMEAYRSATKPSYRFLTTNTSSPS